MINDKNITLKNSMNYGAMGGLAIVVFILIFYFSGNAFSEYLGYLRYAILLIAIIGGTRQLRDRHSGGFITYKNALGSGVLISFFISFIVGFFYYILFEVIDPGLINEYYAMLEEQMLQSGNMSEDEIVAFVDLYKRFTTSLTYSIAYIFAITFMGFISSLIIAIFLKKDTNPFSSANN